VAALEVGQEPLKGFNTDVKQNTKGDRAHRSKRFVAKPKSQPLASVRIARPFSRGRRVPKDGEQGQLLLWFGQLGQISSMLTQVLLRPRFMTVFTAAGLVFESGDDSDQELLCLVARGTSASDTQAEFFGDVGLTLQRFRDKIFV
jgi:hypothetical protein